MHQSLFANKNVRKIYISGPMTGFEQHNFPLFNECAALLRGDFYECSHRRCPFTVPEKVYLAQKEIYKEEKAEYLKSHKGKNYPPFRIFNLCPEHPGDKMRKSKIHYEVINPAELDSEAQRLLKFAEKEGEPILESGGETWANLIRRDQKLVAEVDAIVVLPNWEKSRGAKEEVRAAVGVNTPVYEMDTLELLPANQLPHLNPAGSILDEAQWITEGQRGDNFTHPIEHYTTIAKLKASATGREEEPPEEVALNKLMGALAELITGPNRESAVKVVSFTRCIEMIAEEKGGWHRLRLRGEPAPPSESSPETPAPTQSEERL